MSTRTGAAAAPEARRVVGRHLGVLLWCSFLAACAATMVAFALVDPDAMRGHGEVPHWWTTRMTVYALGFFFFWIIAALSSALTVYMLRTERSE